MENLQDTTLIREQINATSDETNHLTIRTQFHFYDILTKKGGGWLGRMHHHDPITKKIQTNSN